jgi:hypothetical protein
VGVALHLVLVAAALVGLFLSRPDPRKTLVMLLGAWTVIGHLVAFALPRHRLPMMPLLALLAGVTLWRPAGVWAPTPGRIAAAVAAVGVFLALALVPAPVWRVVGG